MCCISLLAMFPKILHTKHIAYNEALAAMAMPYFVFPFLRIWTTKSQNVLVANINRRILIACFLITWAARASHMVTGALQGYTVLLHPLEEGLGRQRWWWRVLLHLGTCWAYPLLPSRSVLHLLVDVFLGALWLATLTLGFFFNCWNWLKLHVFMWVISVDGRVSCGDRRGSRGGVL